MSLIAALDALVTVTFSAAIPMFALGVYQYRDCPFGGVLMVFPIVLTFVVLITALDEVVGSVATYQLLTLVFVVAGALLALLGSIRFYRLASGRWSV